MIILITCIIIIVIIIIIIIIITIEFFESLLFAQVYTYCYM